MKIGRYKISTVIFGHFRLDGGCMFGSVPKNLWSKSIAADDENCIQLVCRSLLLEDGERKILIDVGTGDKWSEKLQRIYGIKLAPPSSLGFNPDEITDVILTHLHFDHAGGITYRDTNGNLALTYPKAKIHLQAANWKRALNPTPKDRASYMAENIEPLKNANLVLCNEPLGVIDTQASPDEISSNQPLEILPEITAHRVDGHTPGQQWIEIGLGSERIFFPTDLIPTSHHVPLAFHMGYDVCADTLLREKLYFLERAAEPGVTVCFQHDPKIGFAKITKDQQRGFNCEPLTS